MLEPKETLRKQEPITNRVGCLERMSIIHSAEVVLRKVFESVMLLLFG